MMQMDSHFGERIVQCRPVMPGHTARVQAIDNGGIEIADAFLRLVAARVRRSA